MVLTSSLAAFLHAVLINVQREQHVGVPSHFLVRVGRAGAARGDGSVQEEGSFLSGRGPQLTLVLELRGLGQRERARLGWARLTTQGLRKRTDVKKIAGKRGKREQGAS